LCVIAGDLGQAGFGAKRTFDRICMLPKAPNPEVDTT